jgi:hypothetical protein
MTRVEDHLMDRRAFLGTLALLVTPLAAEAQEAAKLLESAGCCRRSGQSHSERPSVRATPVLARKLLRKQQARP